MGLIMHSTQLNSTQLNSTQLNSTQLNSTQLNQTFAPEFFHNFSSRKFFFRFSGLSPEAIPIILCCSLSNTTSITSTLEKYSEGNVPLQQDKDE
jgi:hypothetical protein